MKRILTLKNITSSPITIAGVIIGQNEFFYPDFGWWLTEDYKNYYESNTVGISLVDGTQLNFAVNMSNFTYYFIYTARYVRANEELLRELQHQKGQAETVDATITPILELNYPNGVFKPEIEITAEDLNSNNVYIARCFPQIKVRNNILTIINSFTTSALIANDGFNTGGGFGVSGVGIGNKLQVRVKGRAATSIRWSYTVIKKQ